MTESNENQAKNVVRTTRLLIVGLVGVMVVLGLAFVVLILGQSAVPPQTTQGDQRVNALAESNDDCVVCHSRTTPGIVEQYGHSSMAAGQPVGFVLTG